MTAYGWFRFLHILGAFGFLLAHGISVGVALRLRKERDRARVAALLDVSAGAITWLYVSLLVLIGAGVVLGFITHAWGQAWIWTAIGLLVALMGAMYGMATTFYKKLRSIATEQRAGGFKHSDEELAQVLASNRPVLIAVIGFAGLVAILYLMVFRAAAFSFL